MKPTMVLEWTPQLRELLKNTHNSDIKRLNKENQDQNEDAEMKVDVDRLIHVSDQKRQAISPIKNSSVASTNC